MALSCRQAVSFGKKYFFSLPRHLLRPSSSSSVFSVDDEVVYPYIRPKYPPGDWGEITPDKAWQLREMRDTLMSKQTAKRRLEELAELGQVAWIIKSLDARPGTLLFKQYLTKTHVETGLPERYLEMDDSLVDQLVGRVKSQVEDVILLEKEHWLKTNSSSARVHPKDEQAYCRQRLVKQIMDVLINSASYDVPHLLEAQVSAQESDPVFRCRFCFVLSCTQLQTSKTRKSFALLVRWILMQTYSHFGGESTAAIRMSITHSEGTATRREDSGSKESTRQISKSEQNFHCQRCVPFVTQEGKPIMKFCDIICRYPSCRGCEVNCGVNVQVSIFLSFCQWMTRNVWEQ